LYFQKGNKLFSSPNRPDHLWGPRSFCIKWGPGALSPGLRKLERQVVDFLTLMMGPVGCPETSVQNYHSMLRNIPEERISHLHRGGSPKSLVCSGYSFGSQNYLEIFSLNSTLKNSAFLVLLLLHINYVRMICLSLQIFIR
jgi:hypothetical protein